MATDKLYDEGDSGKHVYPMLFTVTLEWMHNMPIVTHIHGTPTYQTDADYLGIDGPSTTISRILRFRTLYRIGTSIRGRTRSTSTTRRPKRGRAGSP